MPGLPRFSGSTERTPPGSVADGPEAGVVPASPHCTKSRIALSPEPSSLFLAPYVLKEDVAMTSRLGLGALIAAVALCPATAQAQADSFMELQGALRRGEAIYLTDDTGHTTKGRVSDVTSSSLAMQVGNDTRVFTLERTRRIEHGDSLANGIMLGVVAGAAAGYGWVSAECGPPGFDPECAANAGIVLIPITAGIGAGVGALVDGVIRKTLYQSSRGSRVALVPVVSRDQRGMRVSIGWR